VTLPRDPAGVAAMLEQLQELAARATSDREIREATARIESLIREYRTRHRIGVPETLIEQAVELDPSYRVRPHLQYLSDRLAVAVRDVESGTSRKIVVSMPPRMGKSTLLSLFGPVWLLRRNPDWSIVTASYDGGLSGSWAKVARKIIEDNPWLGVDLEPDGGAGGYWDTTAGGGLYSTSVRGGLTGRGAKVLVIDDPTSNFVEAHSEKVQTAQWNWWLSVAQLRLEPPSLTLVVMTRWTEKDLVGRLLSDEYEGDPEDWEVISLPGIAETDDVLGRDEGEPLYSPLLEETRAQALDRWADIRRSIGSYVFAGMVQQRPAPAKGAIFDTGWWRFWTMDERRATADGRVVHLDPSSLTGGSWLDSWDCNFDATDASVGSWVVGQRWVRNGANRYLVAQQRGRWTFTQTIARMEQWAEGSDPVRSPSGSLVHQRLIEKKANGAAIIDVLKEKISGLKPINPTASKEARARAVTPEIESGNVYLPHPSDPGNEWVSEFLSELRDFPNGSADDQMDAATQALSGLRVVGSGGVTVPGAVVRTIPRDLVRAAASDRNRYHR